MEITPQSRRTLTSMTIDWCNSHTGFVVGWTCGLVLSIIFMVIA